MSDEEKRWRELGNREPDGMALVPLVPLLRDREEAAAYRAILATEHEGDAEALGQVVREVWVAWAKQRPDSPPHHLVPWEECPEPTKEIDRRIGLAVRRHVVARALRPEAIEAAIASSGCPIGNVRAMLLAAFAAKAEDVEPTDVRTAYDRIREECERHRANAMASELARQIAEKELRRLQEAQTALLPEWAERVKRAEAARDKAFAEKAKADAELIRSREYAGSTISRLHAEKAEAERANEERRREVADAVGHMSAMSSDWPRLVAFIEAMAAESAELEALRRVVTAQLDVNALDPPGADELSRLRTAWREYDALPAKLAAAKPATEKPPVAPVERGHCGRCDRCGWHMIGGSQWCRLGNCSMRPLPERFANCPGCGAPYTDKPELTGDLGKDLEMLIKHDEAIRVAPPKDEDLSPMARKVVADWIASVPLDDDLPCETSDLAIVHLYRDNERSVAAHRAAIDVHEEMRGCIGALESRLVALATRVVNLEARQRSGPVEAFVLPRWSKNAHSAPGECMVNESLKAIEAEINRLRAELEEQPVRVGRVVTAKLASR